MSLQAHQRSPPAHLQRSPPAPALQLPLNISRQQEGPSPSPNYPIGHQTVTTTYNSIPYLSFRPLLSQISDLQKRIGNLQKIHSEQEHEGKDFTLLLSNSFQNAALKPQTLASFLSTGERENWGDILAKDAVISILHNSINRRKALTIQKEKLERKLKEQTLANKHLKQEKIALEKIVGSVGEVRDSQLRAQYFRIWEQKNLL